MILARSLLFVPALNARAVEKSRKLNCDGVILDLEDSIAPEHKDEARNAAISALAEGDYAAPLRMVRVNSVDTEYFTSDVNALAKAGVSEIVVPKITAAADVHAAADLLDAQPAAKDTRLWVMIESALAVMNLREICTASDRLAGLIVGPNDLLKDLRAGESPGQEALLTSFGLCVLAARAYGLICIDGVYKRFKDTEGFTANCAQGQRLGFDGKSLIHPSQIAPCNAAFEPGEEEIALARRQIAGFTEAKALGKGVAVVDGELVEGLHVEIAYRLLEIASAVKQAKGG